MDDHADALGDRLGGLGAGGDLEGQHRAEAVHQPRRAVVAGVARQAGVVDGADRRVGGEALGEDGRGSLAALEPDRHRAQAAEGEEGFEASRHRAERGARVAEGGDALGVARGRDAEHEVGVAADELGRAVEGDVGADLQGPQEERGGEGGVDDDLGARGVRSLDEAVELGDADQRVGRRLGPQQRGAVAGAQRRVGVGEVDLGELDPAGGGALGEQHAHAGVADRRPDDARADRQRLEHRGDRRHAGGERGRLAALQGADGRLERLPRAGAVLARVAVGAVVGRELERDGQRPLRRAAPVHGQRSPDGGPAEGGLPLTPRTPARRAGRRARPRPPSPRAARSARPRGRTPSRAARRPTRTATAARAS